jgi:hypothetical protein
MLRERCGYPAIITNSDNIRDVDVIAWSRLPNSN